MQRMAQSTVQKEYVDSCSSEKRRVGRSRLKWLDEAAEEGGVTSSLQCNKQFL